MVNKYGTSATVMKERKASTLLKSPGYIWRIWLSTC